MKWLILAVVTGVVVGAVSTAFALALRWVNDTRAMYPQLLWGLPIAGVLIVLLHHVLKGTTLTGVNQIIEAARGEKEAPLVMAPLIFLSTVLTHLCGGSAGREGAALQLGGSIGSQLGRWLRLDETHRRGLVMCGMSAAFTALFGTPMTAAVFSMELASVGVMQYGALLPCGIAASVANLIAIACGVEPERFSVAAVQVNPVTTMQALILGALCAVIGILFCQAMHFGAHTASRLVKNPYLRAAAGGCIVIGLTYLLGTRAYLGTGMNLIEEAILEQHVQPEAFLLKIVFTAVTMGCGFKGGEIVPAFCVGATFGCTVGSLLGMEPAMAAAIGLVCVFCAVTNCPIATLLLSFELFGFVSPVLFLAALSVSYMLSGFYSLYGSQQFVTDKLDLVSVTQKGR